MGAVAAKQLGFDLGGDAAPSYAPQLDDIRTELHEIIVTLQESDESPPWDVRTFQYYLTVFPQMARWLPAEERDHLCAKFESEAERLKLCRGG